MIKQALILVLNGFSTISMAQIVNSAQISVGADAIISSDMDFLNTASGRLSNSGTMQLQRNIMNDGFITSKGKVILNGNSVQILAGKKGLEFSNVEFKNEGTVLHTPLRITENALFSNGIVKADETTPLSFAENALATNASDVSHVDGFVKVEKAKEFTFPIGDGSQLKSFTVGKADNFLASYKNESPLDVSADRSETVENMNQNEYWVLKSNGNTNSTNISVPGNLGAEAIVALNKGTWEVSDVAATKKGDVVNSTISLASSEQLFTVGKGRKNQVSVGIFPNPTQGDFYLQFKGIGDNEDVEVKVTLANGISILTIEGKAGQLKKKYSLPEHLSGQGLFLRVNRIQKSQNFVERIVFDK